VDELPDVKSKPPRKQRTGHVYTSDDENNDGEDCDRKAAAAKPRGKAVEQLDEEGTVMVTSPSMVEAGRQRELERRWHRYIAIFRLSKHMIQGQRSRARSWKQGDEMERRIS
jgi:hypothetical protein